MHFGYAYWNAGVECREEGAEFNEMKKVGKGQ
jgi:hypothetical protein